MHSSYKWSKSLAWKAESLCGRGTSQQGTESSAINHTGQVLDALMYFTLWEPALHCALQTYQSQLVESPQGSQLSHSVTGALVLLPQSEFTHGGRVGSSFMPKSNPARGHVLSLVLCTMKHTRSKSNNETSHPSVISIHFPALYLYKQCQLISLVYNVITVKLQQEMCHRLIFLLQ